jgi:hypothetical protein
VHFGPALGQYVPARYSDEAECEACSERVVGNYNTRASMVHTQPEAVRPQVHNGAASGATPRSGEIVDQYATLLTSWSSCGKAYYVHRRIEPCRHTE